MIVIPIHQDFELKKEELIKSGEHQFIIDDVDVQTTNERETNEKIQYLVFSLTDKKDFHKYEKLLSLPLSKKYKISENSITWRVLMKLGVISSADTRITVPVINSVIGKEFSCLVVYDGNFARVDEKTIVLVPSA